MKHSAPDNPIAFDDDGFVVNAAPWDDSMAALIAQRDGINTLTEKHWSIIHTLHNFYARYETIPGVHYLCHMNHIREEDFDKLFKDGLKEACRIAGIPNPGEEAKAYM